MPVKKVLSSAVTLMAMIETTRAFEANTKMIQYQDSLMGGLVNRVLSTSSQS